MNAENFRKKVFEEKILNKSDFENFFLIYTGKDNWCRCGCGGTYHDKPNDRTFKSSITKCINMFNSGAIYKVEIEQEYEEWWANFSYGNNRCFCFYGKN